MTTRFVVKELTKKLSSQQIFQVIFLLPTKTDQIFNFGFPPTTNFRIEFCYPVNPDLPHSRLTLFQLGHRVWSYKIKRPAFKSMRWNYSPLTKVPVSVTSGWVLIIQDPSLCDSGKSSQWRSARAVHNKNSVSGRPAGWLK